MFGMMILDQYWWFAIPGLLLGFYAQQRLSSNYSRFSQVGLGSRISGAEAAREILDNAGLYGVPVNEVEGHLTDHYDPMKRALFLSSENYSGRSVAAVGVAAHEAGHALQNQAAYAPLKIRMALVPITSFASTAATWIFMAGFFMNLSKLAVAGVAVFLIVTLFQLVTLPVEYDASRRAKNELLRLGLVRTEEAGGVGRVLNAAALTYVAAMVSSFLTLLHFVMIARGDDRE